VNPYEHLEHILYTVVNSLTDYEATISIVSMATQTLQVHVMCDECDKGRIIGRDGITIRSIRTILHCAAAKYGFKTYLNISQ
jgi:predicted RNA-binding protein YlqC (UPF0109 family)